MRQQATASPPGYGAAGEPSGQALAGRDWSRQLKLAALPSAVPWARRMLRQSLREWQLESMSDTALLLVSELITNAVNACASRASAGRRFARLPMMEVCARVTGTRLVLEVWDASPVPPVRRDGDLTGDSGRGLLIVECLSDDWGHQECGEGKVVWCEIALPRPAGLAHARTGRQQAPLRQPGSLARAG
ncbi:MAG TPA: ATP-binding protein [Streptosporangiaceae bacterium]